MLRTVSVIVIILLISFSATSSYAQEEDFNNIVKIVKSGNSKELVKKFGSSVELNMDGDEASYSKSQAEAVLKDFFGKNPPKMFEVNHKGESKGGLPYAIGEYTSGSSIFRVWIRLNQKSGKFYVSEMSFIKE